MNFSNEDYKKLCSECNQILKSFSDNTDILSLPWLHVLNEHPTTLKKYKNLLRDNFWLKNFIRKEILHLFFYFLKNFLLSIIVKPPKSELELNKNEDVLFISHIFNEDQIFENEDFYFGDAPNYLIKKGLNVRILLRNHSKKSSSFLQKKISHRLDTHKLFFSENLSFLKLLKIFYSLIKGSNKLRRLSKSNKGTFEKKILLEASMQMLSVESFKAILFNQQLKDLVIKIKPKIVITTLEGHSQEKLVFNLSKSINPKSLCIGYQHTILFPNQNSIFFHPSDKYVPDIILTSGMINKSVLEDKIKLKNRPKILNAGTYRSSNIIKKETNMRLENKKCLILPDGNIEDIENFSKLLCDLSETNHNFLVRLHPAHSLEKLQQKYKFFLNKNKNITFSSNKKIEDDLCDCSWAVYRGTGAIIYAIQNDLKPIYLQAERETLPIDPLYKFGNPKEIISNMQDLEKILKKDKLLNEDKFLSQLYDLKNFSLNYFEPFKEKEFHNLLMSHL